MGVCKQERLGEFILGRVRHVDRAGASWALSNHLCLDILLVNLIQTTSRIANWDGPDERRDFYAPTGVSVKDIRFAIYTAIYPEADPLP